MIKGFVSLFVLCLVCFLFSCSSANNKPLLIDFSSDRTAILFNNIDQSGLLQLQQAKDDQADFETLISVLETPSVSDSTFKERPVEGKVFVTDSNLVFIPSKPFITGRDYLVVTHLNSRFGSVKKMMRGELKPGVKAIQKLLTR